MKRFARLLRSSSSGGGGANVCEVVPTVTNINPFDNQSMQAARLWKRTEQRPCQPTVTLP